MPVRSLEIPLDDTVSSVSGLWERPEGAHAALVFAHGAGAGMQHAFMEAATAELAQRGIATLRFPFPYMAAGRRRPDHRRTLVATVRAAVARTVDEAAGLPVFAGGKSMGGRMTSLAASASALEPTSELEGLEGIRGVVFFGFPLHAAGKEGSERADHLFDFALPLLFLQGTRDKLADLERLQPICERLGERATLHIVEGADHSFHVLKRSGRSDAEVLTELADAVAAWVRAQLA